ncbi:molybdate ABC transporter substrate-binding protein [Aliiroseovarius crassostreae]|uniref:molybdate ABC transporter substrate-binding protein n=1 Tax=Aliiroseovarius crassostreae TaxID=154981 RepID=UPI003C7CC3A9
MLKPVLQTLAALALIGGIASPLSAGQVTVFAAASLKTALEQMAAEIEAATGHELTLSFAGSSALARQVEYGAPADIYISANPGWMDHLASKGLIDADSRVDLVGNRLALVGQGAPVEISPELDLAARLGDGRLAMALVNAVPAGIYGKAALDHLGLWASVKTQVAQADNVRAALALVAQGAAPLGIVYESDAVADPRVTVLGLFPEDSHPPIRYPAARLTSSGPAAADVLNWLASPAAEAGFVAGGFQVLERDR